MDALLATFTGQTASSAASQTPDGAGESSVFDGLLAAAGIAPIAPVPPVVPRQMENRPQSLLQSAAPGQSVTATPAAVLTEPLANPAPSGIPTTALAPQTTTGTPPQAAGTGIQTETPQPVGPTLAQTGPATQATTNAPVQPGLAETPSSVTQSSIAASTTGEPLETTPVPNAKSAAEKPAVPMQAGPANPTSGKASVQTVMPAAPESAPVNTNSGTTPSGSLPGSASGNPVATAQASVNAAAANPAVPAAAPIQQQAGVQARRETDALSAQTGQKSVAKPAGGAGASLPTQPAQTAQAAPAAPAASAPPPAQSPDINASLPRSGGAEPLMAAPQGDRPAPPPISIEAGSSTPEGDAETADIAQMRSAEISRTAERPGTAAGTARFTPANAGTLAAQIASRFQNGERRFEIRMDPPELGRVEVKLHVSNDNRVQAVLSADRPETLQDMRQHIRELERALAEAGLDLSEDGLSFELSQDRDDTHENPSSPNAFSELAFAESASGDVVAASLPRELYGFQLARSGGVDVRL